MPTAAEWTTTAVNLALVGAVLAFLHTSVGFNGWLTTTYAQWHAVLSHRLTEGCVAVASFAAAAFFYSFVDAFGALKLRTVAVEAGKGRLVVRAASSVGAHRERAVGFTVDHAAPKASSFLPSTP